ncbi:acyl-CoA dehydrogenase [Burkholderia sp. WAC0059]|uniref:acyl-CoA dehydrogenase family protein n=1 Tax=Burkholderia sp. WAC0059 TaxID=2066022 RepID=UPI000C7EF2FC|nr:acyl-CoA dehydrogenase family protein [Burkholderia sp. WAC0059]PLZ03563.1 acyl-CoA dehydrogenase [Burkholderia sp. WAC0059]
MSTPAAEMASRARAASPGADSADADAADRTDHPGFAPPTAATDWLAAAGRVAEVAARHADAVDRDARFPAEAFVELRREGLLSALIPPPAGGAGLSLDQVARICETLAQGCSSTAMIYAMHQIQVACMVDHGMDVAWQRDALARIASQQLLLASATSEENIGGSMRTSACAVERGHGADGIFRIEKRAPTVSYGAHADAILITARRASDAAPSDQVLIVAFHDQIELEKYGGWNALGMRGTCSEGFRLVAHGRLEQILPVPFASISGQTMLPVSHVLWAAVWTGIAAGAVNRAHAFFREAARKQPGTLPPSAHRLAEANALVHLMRSRVRAALETLAAQPRPRVDETGAHSPLSASLGFACDMNTLKLAVSATALRAVEEALMICGMAGYRNDTRYSVGRPLRDLFSAPLMISNDRIALNTANLLLAQRPELRPESADERDH